MANSKLKNKHELKDILSLLMEESDIDDAQLARETGIPASTISRMRINENSNPTAATLRPISKYFSISINQLLGDQPLPNDRLPGTHNPTYFTSVRMPILEWSWITSWIESQYEDLKTKLTLWISTEKEVGLKTFALNIPTDSLGIAFRKGSTIIIDPEQSPIDGDCILIQDKHEKTFLLKQFLLDGNDIYLRSINPEIKSITQLNDMYKIVGVIIETRFSLQETKKIKFQKEKKQQSVFVKSLLNLT